MNAQNKASRTNTLKLASLRLEIPATPEVLYLINRETDDLPPLIVGRASWEDFPGGRRSSYWIQITEVFGTSIEFINDQWYSIFWSESFNSYYTEEDQYDEEPDLLGLGSLARFLQTQETVEGKKHDRKESLSTQESSKCPASKRTREGDSSSIQESISDSNEESRRQELAKSLELNIGITPTPDNPQTAMSYTSTIERTATAVQSPSGASPFLITGMTGSYQTAQRSGSGQTGSTSFGQRAPAQHTTGQAGLGPSWGPTSASTGGSLSGGLQMVQQQQLVQVQRPQTPPAPPATPPGGPPQAAAPQQVAQAPHGTDGAMKGQPPTIFDGERLKTNQFMTEFQLWWMINSGAEVMNNPFQRIALCLSFIRGPKVDNWVEEKINQLQRAVLGDPANGILPTHRPTNEALWNSFGADFKAAYQDTAAEENAYAQLKDLYMIEDRIDEYIAHFEVLLVKAGWSCQDKGSINILFNGLTRTVQRKILSLYATLPVTLDEWQSVARQIVQRYRLIDVKIGPWKPRKREPDSEVRWNQRKHLSGADQDPNAMDIDTTEININTAQKEKPVICYYCNNKGHSKRDCRKLKADQQKGENESPNAKVRAAMLKGNEVEKEASPNPDSLMAHISRLETEDCNNLLDHLFDPGTEESLDCLGATIHLRTTTVKTTYARRAKAFHIDFKLLTIQQVTERQALLDSGASENLINKETWKTLETGAFTLTKPIAVHNLDGTENKQGKITQYCWLRIKRGDEEQWMRFFIADTGKDHFVLGYPFLSAFNPQVDWSKGQISGPTTNVLTVEFKQAQKQLKRVQLRAIRTCARQPKTGEAIYYRRVMTTQETHNW